MSALIIMFYFIEMDRFTWSLWCGSGLGNMFENILVLGSTWGSQGNRLIFKATKVS